MLRRVLLAASLVACAAATNAVGTAFLESNRKRPDVVTLPSGLQYRIIESGAGSEHPLPDTEASCHYEGRTASNYPNGKTFDSSFARGEPASFAPSGVVRGWTEAMQLMVPGDKWELFIPAELGYGDAGAGEDIGPGDALVFTLQMISLNGPGKPLSAEELAARKGKGHAGRGMGRNAKRLFATGRGTHHRRLD